MESVVLLEYFLSLSKGHSLQIQTMNDVWGVVNQENGYVGWYRVRKGVQRIPAPPYTTQAGLKLSVPILPQHA